MENLDNIVTSALSAVEAASDAAALDEVRVQYMGKKGELNLSAQKTLANCPPRNAQKRVA